MRHAGDMLGPGAVLIIGVDLVKDTKILCPAYNDTEGVTAKFNLNLLARINRELGADFDLAAFELAHIAHFLEIGREYNYREGARFVFVLAVAEGEQFDAVFAIFHVQYSSSDALRGTQMLARIREGYACVRRRIVGSAKRAKGKKGCEKKCPEKKTHNH